LGYRTKLKEGEVNKPTGYATSVPIEPFHGERHSSMQPGGQGMDKAIGEKERSMDASALVKRSGSGETQAKGEKIEDQVACLMGKPNA
jgi:hypothetical protein